MRRIAPALLVAAMMTAPAVQAQSPETVRSRANPSAVIAAEIAFNRLAQKEGQWTALLETSAPEAEMFAPQRVKAQTWLKDRPNPPQTTTGDPHAVWSSCDGGYAVTRGGWQNPDGRAGYFTTLWQRQPKKGDYKWLLEQGNEQAAQVAAPDMISGLVADCRERPRSPAGSVPLAAAKKRPKPPAIPVSPGTNTPIPGTQPITISLEGDRKDGRSRDGTLDWSSVVAADGARIFVVRMWKDGEMREVLRTAVDAELATAKP